MATHKALVLHQLNATPVLEEIARPVPQPGQLLVKVDASTINPSDRMRIIGAYFHTPLPAVVGLQGTGHVVQANGEDIQNWVGKRISFTQNGSGTWGQYTITIPDKAFPIDQTVDLTSAASGVVNPLTVIGMIDIYNKSPHKKGLIHTAAASALGRMLNKYAKTLGIPLLNIVRREQQAAILKAQGAEHVIITKGDWQTEYKEAIKTHGFNIFFDALGGGQVLQSLIGGLEPQSWVHIYGGLELKPFTLKTGLNLSRGIYVTGYMLFGWYSQLTAEEKQKIKDQYSHLLSGDLKTHSYKVLKYSDIKQGLTLSVEKTLEGKITLVPN